MAKYDPAKLKKVIPSKLIAAAKEIGIPNAERVHKETLIDAFLDAVEKAQDTDPSKLTANIVNLYNEIVNLFDLAEEPPSEGGEEEVAPEPEPEPEPELEPELEPEPEPASPPPPMARRPGRPPTPRPSATPPAAAPSKPTPAAPAAAKAIEKPPKEKKEKKPTSPRSTFSRWSAMGEAIVSMKSGSVEDLIAKADEIYVSHNGKSNLREATTITKFTLSTLKAMGYANVTGDSFTLIK